MIRFVLKSSSCKSSTTVSVDSLTSIRISAESRAARRIFLGSLCE